MINTRLLVLLVLMPGSLLAQKTRKIVRELSNGTVKETYEVLKSDTSIKNGVYKFAGARFLTIGYFKNNRKDSVWTSYGYGHLSSVGRYKDGLRCGIWEFYNYKGELENKIDFSSNKLIFHKADQQKDSTKYAVVTGKDTIYTTLTRPPMYEGGNAKISGIMASALRYPARARENNTTGNVIIAVTIDENGRATNYRIKKYINNGLSEEALRVVRLLDNNWIPGLLNNKPVASEFCFPVSFSLAN